MQNPRRLEDEAICRRVAEARAGAGLTREELAQSLTACTGVTVGVRDVRRFEKPRVPWNLLSEIGRLTATSKGWLLYGEKFLAEEEGREVLWEKPARVAELDEILGRTKTAPSRMSAGFAGVGLGAALLAAIVIERATGSIVAAMAAVVVVVLVAFLRYFR